MLSTSSYTSSPPICCAVTSGRRGSNPRHQAWKACALPTELLPRLLVPLDPPRESHGGGRIRTFEGVSRQIYSLLPLAAWVPHRIRASAPATPALSASDDNRVSRPRADGGNRTHNRRFTKPELCRLSYVSNGVFARDSYNKRAGNQCQAARLRGVRARWRSPLARRARSCSS